MERFRYDLEDPAKPQETFRDLRALLVARNPVANQAPSKYARDDSNPGDGDRNDTPTNTGQPVARYLEAKSWSTGRASGRTRASNPSTSRPPAAACARRPRFQ